ncbi:PE family protein PE9 [Mycobacterium tuberculosis 3280CJ]|uniref:PE family protein n=1 Tax=Mycobacterium tuberculosis TaxID=1773 RepID=UPI000459A489|nr:PE family protein [Mycobacterium tuberculosis]KBT40191.1 PE family protein PE9 [Mycobacterium tuberculosis 3280CJ]KBT41062.1 PE family protein PE9 [Mycobacterium tuberculosis 3280CJ]
MSYMIATPAALTAAATDIDGIGSAVSVANAAAVAATTGVLAAGGDEVLAAIARLFNANAEEYHALSAQVAAFQTLFVRTLTGGCGVIRRRRGRQCVTAAEHRAAGAGRRQRRRRSGDGQWRLRQQRHFGCGGQPEFRQHSEHRR